MKEYLFDTAFTAPQEVAARDRDEYLVEAILDHSGNFNRKAELTFLFRWVGYAADFDQRILWANLRHNDRFHTYLQDKGMRSQIPKFR